MTTRFIRWIQLNPRMFFLIMSTFSQIFIIIATFRNNFYVKHLLAFENFNGHNLPSNHRLKGRNNSVLSNAFKKDETLKLFSRFSNEQQTNAVFQNLNSVTILCPLFSTLLVGWVDISLKVSDLRKEKEDEFEKRIKETGLKMGGSYKPTNCQSRHKVAIVVPYRNRKEQLIIFLRYMHPFLQRQQLEYVIFIVEQSDNLPFNRGILMNIAFKEAQLLDQFQCFIFHDVDLLPENDGNPYDCPENGKPRHLSYIIDIFDYKPTPFGYFGGVNAFSTHDFQLINGFSNAFWGWGGEDDDLLQRTLFHNMTVKRPFDDQEKFAHRARYRTLYHRPAIPNPDRHQLIKEGNQRHQTDGLIDLYYQILTFKFKPLYTYLLVNVQQDR